MNTRSSVHEWIRSVVLLVMLLVLPQACAAQDRTVAERGADLEAAMWTGETEHAKEILDSGPIPETNSENLCWIQARWRAVAKRCWIYIYIYICI